MTDWDDGYFTALKTVSELLGIEGDGVNETDVYRRVKALMGLAKEVADAYDSKPDYWCSCSQCEKFKEHAEEVLDGNYWRDE